MFDVSPKVFTDGCRAGAGGSNAKRNGTSGCAFPRQLSRLRSRQQYQPNRSSPRLCQIFATTYRALPSDRDRFTAPSAFTCPCDAIATNRGYPSPWFDLLLAIKALSPYPAAPPANSNLSLYLHSFRCSPSLLIPFHQLSRARDSPQAC
jgi:hypothetical protein